MINVKHFCLCLLAKGIQVLPVGCNEFLDKVKDYSIWRLRYLFRIDVGRNR